MGFLTTSSSMRTPVRWLPDGRSFGPSATNGAAGSARVRPDANLVSRSGIFSIVDPGLQGVIEVQAAYLFTDDVSLKSNCTESGDPVPHCSRHDGSPLPALRVHGSSPARSCPSRLHLSLEIARQDVTADRRQSLAAGWEAGFGVSRHVALMPRAATRDEEARHEKQVDDHNTQREKGESTQFFLWFCRSTPQKR
jgi:hypothetical protein